MSTVEFFGRKLRVGAPELQIYLKLRVIGTINRRERVGHKLGTSTYDFPMLDKLARLGELRKSSFVHSAFHFSFSPSRFCTPYTYLGLFIYSSIYSEAEMMISLHYRVYLRNSSEELHWCQSCLKRRGDMPRIVNKLMKRTTI